MGVTDLNAYREQRDVEDSPHLSGTAVCLLCRHEWVAVSPAGCVSELECPECHTYRGVMKANCAPPDGVPRFTCNCDCQTFEVTQHGVLCIFCGAQTSFSELVETE
tara:strand:+ start:394 stop:711 length:318 start_codon:yes stop_codon:yes gene_type:complete